MEKILYKLATIEKRNIFSFIIYYILFWIYFILLTYFTIIRVAFFWENWLFFVLVSFAPALAIIPFYIWNLYNLFKIFKIIKDKEGLEEWEIKESNKYFKRLFLIGFWRKKTEEKLEKKSIKQKEKLKKIACAHPLLGLYVQMSLIFFTKELKNDKFKKQN
ncbi:hypothetical protein [Mycoplasma sp. 1012]